MALQVRSRPEAIPAITEKLIRYLQAHPDLEHYEGRLLLVEAHRIRILGAAHNHALRRRWAVQPQQKRHFSQPVLLHFERGAGRAHRR